MSDYQITVTLSQGITKYEAQEIATGILLFAGVKATTVVIRPTPHAADLPRACAAGNHYTNDVGRGRDFSFCPDCGKPLM